jgi:hypothetical protein
VSEITENTPVNATSLLLIFGTRVEQHGAVSLLKLAGWTQTSK